MEKSDNLIAADSSFDSSVKRRKRFRRRIPTSPVARRMTMLAIGLLFLVATLSAQTLSTGDPVLIKLHDYHAATFIEKRGELFLVNRYSDPAYAELVPAARLIPLRKDWAVGEWVLSDWTNERAFIKAQVVHVEDGRFLCVRWPQREALWRDYWSLVPLEYSWILGQHFDSSLNYRKPDTARIAGDAWAIDAAGAPMATDDSAVEVEWSGEWYKAKILEQKDGRYYISYVGYSSSWDEWVGPERVRPASTAGDAGEWRIGEIAWNTFTNEGRYYQVKLLATDGELWLCMELISLDVDWKTPEDLYTEKPEQTFFPGK
jgi:hypothetical protein